MIALPFELEQFKKQLPVTDSHIHTTTLQIPRYSNSNGLLVCFVCRNNTPDVIVPIRLTIRLRGEDDTANDELRAIVEEQVKSFGYRLSINASIILFSMLLVLHYLHMNV